MMFVFLTGFATAAFAGALAATAQQTPAQVRGRYLAEFSDGARLEGQQLHDWHSAALAPRLDNTPLFTAERTLRWLRDRQQPEQKSPPAFIETRLGDRLPGVVTALQAASEQPLAPTPAHFIVAPACELRLLRNHKSVRVLSKYVRRIVWQGRGLKAGGAKRYTPARLYFREGGSLPYRSLRWADGKVVLLLDVGTRQVAFDDIAELHFPQQNQWRAYFDTLAARSPDAVTPLLQIHTRDGLIATSSTARFAASSLGDPRQDVNWLHYLQPAWSLDSLPIPHANIAERLYFPAVAPPLSLFSPVREKQTSLLGDLKWPARTNRNVSGGRLFTDGKEYASGFGVFGATELHFDLPACADAFSTRVGFDRLAANGGCVQALGYFASAPEKLLFDTGVLLGGRASSNIARTPLPRTDRQARRLVLKIDPAPPAAPQDADPFDIRDIVNWLDPTLLLNRSELKRQVDLRRIETVPAWRGWSLANPAAIAWRAVSDQAGGFHLLPYAENEPLKLTRRVRPSEQRWLVLQIESPLAAATNLLVRAEGEIIAKWNIPPQPLRAKANHFAVSLEAFQNREEVQLEIEAPAGVALAWRGLALFKNPPYLYSILEEPGDNTQAALLAPETHTWRQDIRFHGKSALQLQKNGVCKIVFSSPCKIRQTPDVGEFRYLRFAYRKSGGGGVRWRMTTAAAPKGKTFYRAGKGGPNRKGEITLWRLELPDHWIVATRDLFADLGETDLTGLVVEARGGESLWLDHMHFANQLDDFQLLSAPDPAITNRAARRLLAQEVLQKGAATAVSLRIGGRPASGILISAAGDVLTAGHVLGKSAAKVEAVLPDGRTANGRVVAISRDGDLGLIRLNILLNGQDQQPHVAIAGIGKIADDQLYVDFSFQADAQGKLNLASPIVGIREATKNEIWIDGAKATASNTAPWQAGGALLDRDSRVVGIRSRRHSAGGFLYQRVSRAVLARLREGETWGAWPSGAGPTFGVTIETTVAGCMVTMVAPRSAAAKAGLRADDLITRLDGVETRVLSDIYRILSSHDPGEIVSVHWLRGGKPSVARLKLEPRSP